MNKKGKEICYIFDDTYYYYSEGVIKSLEKKLRRRGVFNFSGFIVTVAAMSICIIETRREIEDVKIELKKLRNTEGD